MILEILPEAPVKTYLIINSIHGFSSSSSYIYKNASPA